MPMRRRKGGRGARRGKSPIRGTKGQRRVRPMRSKGRRSYPVGGYVIS